MSLLDEVKPTLARAAEPLVLPVPAGAVKVLPRWSDDDDVQRWRLKYRVRQAEERDDDALNEHAEWIELELRPFTRELPLTGLDHGLLHFFRVAIETVDGWSDWSRVVNCVPPSPELPGKCAAVLAVVKDKVTALVRWTRPIDSAASVSCGEIRSYRLLVTCMGGDPDETGQTREIQIDEFVESFPVTSLSSCCNYTFQIAAENVTGWGDWSDPSAVLHMPLPVPAAPTKPTLRRATHHTVVIQWQHPDPGDAPITTFGFRHTTGSDTWKAKDTVVEIHDIQHNLSQYVVQGLAPGLEYFFQARAVNKYGAGIWSETSIPIKTLDGGEPAMIENLTVPHIYKSFITLQWPPAFDNGWEVTKHIMRHAHSEDMADATNYHDVTVVRQGHFDTCSLRHLVKGRAYYFQVAAFNKNGTGPWSQPVIVSLDERPQLRDD